MRWVSVVAPRGHWAWRKVRLGRRHAAVSRAQPFLAHPGIGEDDRPTFLVLLDCVKFCDWDAMERTGFRWWLDRIAEVIANDIVIENGKVQAYRTKLKVSFKLDDGGGSSRCHRFAQKGYQVGSLRVIPDAAARVAAIENGDRRLNG